LSAREREGERGREKERERAKESERARARGRARKRERARERESARESERKRERARENVRERERARESERERARAREGESERGAKPLYFFARSESKKVSAWCEAPLVCARALHASILLAVVTALTWIRGHTSGQCGAAEALKTTDSKHEGCIPTPGCVSRPLSPTPLLVWARRAIERARQSRSMYEDFEGDCRTRRTVLLPEPHIL